MSERLRLVESRLPRLSRARVPLVHEVEVVNEWGDVSRMAIPAERPLTVYLDKQEIVTLMTLGAQPEWLVLGYLLNQRLVGGVGEVESVTVDWEVGAAAVRTRSGAADVAQRTARRIVTTGCGQGSAFDSLMDALQGVRLSPQATVRQSDLQALVNTMRLQDSVYKAARSVHGCALFAGTQLLVFVEDVGRHNAVDAIAGWMQLQEPALRLEGDAVFYTTGRLTSEMVIKAAQMGIAVVVSRSGITQMGLEVAQRAGVCAIGRATHRRFLCFSHPERIVFDAMPARPELQEPVVAALGAA